MMPNYDQVTGIIRAVVPALITYLALKFPQFVGHEEIITAAVVAIAAAVWSVLNNKTGKTIK